MRRLRFDILRRLLLTALCALLFVSCMPAVPAFAAGLTYFDLRAEANGYSSSAQVSFVDADKNPLHGTVTGSITCSYTGTGPESNETNTIDLYQFQDMIDPEIADEYDFSRVYVQFEQGAGDQKNFRYMQVGDETAITSTGNTSLYRGYLYQTSIDECQSGQDYHGTWYNLEAGGAMDPIFIEFNHVAEASFNSLDAGNDPVEGAQFALYSDSCCYTPYEYKDEPVVATSNESGRVSFGKIPQGTYYMKETVVPNGYNASTQVYTIVVDGNTPIADVIHQNDDGSAPIADAKTLDTTITNKTTTYPIQFMNVTYPNKTALPGMKFDLYTQQAYDAAERGKPFEQTLIADSDGILKTPDDESTFELGADSYCLAQSEEFGDYPLPEQPVRFTITSDGALEVLQADQEIRDFAYSSTTTDEKLLLQIPHFKPATVEMLFQVQGDYADLTKKFEFRLAIPEGMSEIEACVDDTPVTLSAENNTVALSHGQRLKLMNVPDSESYELTQTDALVAQSSDADSGCYNPQVPVVTEGTVKATLKHDDARVLTLSELKGTETSPAKVTITNMLQNNKVPITGIDNDDSPWLAMVFASAAALAVLCALWLLRKHRHKTKAFD